MSAIGTWLILGGGVGLIVVAIYYAARWLIEVAARQLRRHNRRRAL